MAAMSSPITRPRKTLEDYLALPDDVRAELIDGELYVSAAPSPWHQRAVVQLVRLLGDELDRLGLGEVLVAPCDVHLPNGDVVQPDVFVLKAGQEKLLERSGFHGAPLLAIEVLSPFHPERDRFVKMWRYAQSGIAEYWLADPELRSVEVFTLQEGPGPEARFAPAGWFTGDAQVTSGVLPGLDLTLEAIFRP